MTKCEIIQNSLFKNINYPMKCPCFYLRNKANNWKILLKFIKMEGYFA